MKFFFTTPTHRPDKLRAFIAIISQEGATKTINSKGRGSCVMAWPNKSYSENALFLSESMFYCHRSDKQRV